jgi:anti-sigma regulatory factor (Ser/Thr protein kinase)/putative methionine-R-sulfoxide reductase with GAF domain
VADTPLACIADVVGMVDLVRWRRGEMATPSRQPDTSLLESDVREALASVDHLRKLQRVTDAALANLTVDELLDELLVRVREALETDTAAILLLDPDRGELVARAAKGIEEEVREGVRIPVGRGFAGTIAATGQPLSIYEVDHTNVANPILLQKGIRSLLGVPLLVQGRTLGVLHVGTLRKRRFTPDDEELLRLVGDRVALALHVGLYERERAAARTLQRSLLPEKLPSAPGYRLAVRYVPSGGGEVGGDWYDAFFLPGGSIAVVIGDVVGRGLHAASIMAKLRNSLRAFALELPSPGEVLQRMDRLLQHLDPEEMATVLYGTIDAVDQTFRFASAGHPPPMIRDPDGLVRIMEIAGGPPLGTTLASGAYPEGTEKLRAGTALALYTDGLIERRTASLDQGLDSLAQLFRAKLPPEEQCDAILDALTEGRNIDDDVALLIIEVASDPGDRWEISVPAQPRQLHAVRRLVRRWLAQRDVSSERTYDVLAGSGEAVANAIHHAYGPAGGAVEVSAEWTQGEIVMRIRDAGRWRFPRDASRGRGISMMHSLTDDVHISRSDTGTLVELRWSLQSR